jgi:hypothetical protein
MGRRKSVGKHSPPKKNNLHRIQREKKKIDTQLWTPTKQG